MYKQNRKTRDYEEDVQQCLAQDIYPRNEKYHNRLAWKRTVFIVIYSWGGSVNNSLEFVIIKSVYSDHLFPIITSL